MHRYKWIRYAAFGLLMLAVNLSGLAANPDLELIILHTNDTHGHPVKFFDYPADGVGGLAARATLVAEFRKEYPHVLLLDAGDLNTGRPESTFFHAEPDILGYNALGYDAMVLGNHEFDNTLAILQRQMEIASFPFLSANVRYKDGRALAPAYIIKEFSGFRVAILGLTTHETATVGNPQVTRDLIFEDEVAVARRWVPMLRQRADLIIALTHLGISPDATSGSRRLAKEVPGIDLIVDGHSHTRLEAPIYEGKTPIVQAWQWGLYVGKGVFTIRNGTIASFQWEAIPINLKKVETTAEGTKVLRHIGEELPEDPMVLQLLSPYLDKVETLLKEKVGETSEAFPHDKARLEETALGNLTADALKWSTRNLKPDFALINGGSLRATLPMGIITRGNIYESLPFDNTVVVLDLQGDDFLELCQFIATTPGKGAFPQVSSGIKLVLDSSREQCVQVRVGGKPIDPKRIYRIATLSYLAAGGDGYQGFLKAKRSYDTSVFCRDAVIEYLNHHKDQITPVIHGRIKLDIEFESLAS